MSLITTKNITTKNGKYFAGARVFITDGYGGIFEQGDRVNMFFCKRNGRSIKTAIAEALNSETFA